MSVDKLRMPADLEHYLRRKLPTQGINTPIVKVTPRDEEHHKCAVWLADHYEVAAYYYVTSHDLLVPLEEALRQVAGVYLITQLWGDGYQTRSVTVSNPDWPEFLGTKRRGGDFLRPSVRALMSDQGLESR